nr:hypothetical protein [Paenibacillus andongensis]
MVGLEALFAGPISGASMNPARSLRRLLSREHTTICGFILSLRLWAQF